MPDGLISDGPGLLKIYMSCVDSLPLNFKNAPTINTLSHFQFL